MAKFKIFISEYITNRLKLLKEGDGGIVFTIEQADEITAIALYLPQTKGDEDFYYEELAVPFGAVPLGAFFVSSIPVNSEADLIIRIHPETKEITVEYRYDNVLEEKYTILSGSDIAAKFYLLRVLANIPVLIPLSIDGIEEEINRLRDRIDDAVFIPELVGQKQDKPYVFAKKSYKSINDIDVLQCSLKLKRSDTQPMIEEPEPRKALAIDYVIGSVKCCSYTMQLDALTFVPKIAPVSDALEWLEVSLKRNLTMQESFLREQIKSNVDAISTPETFHFLPEGAGHFLTIIYPKNKLDQQLVNVRSTYHEVYALGNDRPLLMRGNAFSFKAETVGSELENPHHFVPSSGVQGGEPALVQGRYSYHHYCQQGEDDDGWGCAYRSLQTLCSWFKLQGYTNRTVPTIREIQQCLVSIGDKPANFVGSRQWIGSTEVGFCLDTLLGISSRIVSVSSGEELSMKGGELTHHFKTQGTPVMIGGGNLAHTILGVDYNRKTGDIKFLILDPHYTGTEDINVIINKGWCGWKPLTFWKKGSFYNMCMPIKPNCI